MKILKKIAAFWRCHFQKTSLTEKAKLGRAGEQIAAEHLRSQGFKIIVKNWKSGRDEIDLVARDNENLVFVEVKTRSVGTGENDTAGIGYRAVDARKRNALFRACRAYLSGLRMAPAHFRFDVVEVKMFSSGKFEIAHHRAVALFPKYFSPNKQR